MDSERQLPCNYSGVTSSLPTAYTFPRVSHLTVPTLSDTSTSFSNLPGTPLLTDPSSALTGTSSGVTNQHQTCHFGLEDAPFINVPVDFLPDDHSDLYVPSDNGESDNESEQASQISNSEVCLCNVGILLMFIALQLADNLPRVTTRKKERRAAAQAKQVIGTGKRKRSSNKSRPAPAKRHRTEPSPNAVPTGSSIDCEQSNNLFASRKRKPAVNHILALTSNSNLRYARNRAHQYTTFIQRFARTTNNTARTGRKATNSIGVYMVGGKYNASHLQCVGQSTVSSLNSNAMHHSCTTCSKSWRRNANWVRNPQLRSYSLRPANELLTSYLINCRSNSNGSGTCLSRKQ